MCKCDEVKKTCNIRAHVRTRKYSKKEANTYFNSFDLISWLHSTPLIMLKQHPQILLQHTHTHSLLFSLSLQSLRQKPLH